MSEHGPVEEKKGSDGADGQDAASPEAKPVDPLKADPQADLGESSGAGLDASVMMPSDVLYIVRERNYLVELEEALDEKGIQLREEAP